VPISAPGLYRKEPGIAGGRHLGLKWHSVLAMDLGRYGFEQGVVVEDSHQLTFVSLTIDPDDGATVREGLRGPLLPDPADGRIHVATDDVELAIVDL
jgi:hypothetical protein